MATRTLNLPGRSRLASSVTVVGALLAFAAAALLALLWLRVSLAEFRDLILYLLASSLVSGAVGYAVYRWTETGRRSIRTKILLAYGVGIVIVVVNILVTARLMFLSSHDLGLLMLLMVFGTVLSVSFGASIAGRMTRVVQQLSEGARRVSGGDLNARVDVVTNDELADLARSFNDMVANVNESEEMRRRAELARRELVAAVSHDLRTPLAAMQAMLEALRDGVVDEPGTIRRYHETMSSQVAHLSHLIDDLFELSQLDAQPQPYELVRADVVALVRETVEGAAMSAVGREIAVHFAGESPLYARVEQTKIARVVTNLVDNALRHSPAGSTLLVSVTEGSGQVEVRVEDDGPGVDEGDLGRVFDRFYRGERSRSRSHGGAGLGLAIARGIVEAHGGDISVANRERGGACFMFRLPLAGVPPP